MIISYCNREYFDGAKIFVESFSMFHPEEKIHLNTINLNNKDEKQLQKLHKNLIIDNKILTIKDLSDRHKTSEEEIRKSRIGCCYSSKKHNHRLFMNMIADGDRIEKYYPTMVAYDKEELYILADIDLLFRKSLYPTIEEAKKHDVGLKLRMGKKSKLPGKLNTEGKQKDALINIGTVTVKNNDNGLNFVKTGIKYVNSSPMKKRHGIKWGQWAIAMAYNELVDSVDFFKFKNGTFSPYLKEDAPVWFFKSKKKEKDIRTARKELNALRKR